MLLRFLKVSACHSSVSGRLPMPLTWHQQYCRLTVVAELNDERLFIDCKSSLTGMKWVYLRSAQAFFASHFPSFFMSAMIHCTLSSNCTRSVSLKEGPAFAELHFQSSQGGRRSIALAEASPLLRRSIAWPSHLEPGARLPADGRRQAFQDQALGLDDAILRWHSPHPELHRLLKHLGATLAVLSVAWHLRG